MTGGPAGVLPRLRSGAAVAVGAFGALCGVSGFALALASRLSLEFLTFPIMAVSFAAVGTTVAVRRPRNPVGWIFLAVGSLFGGCGFAFTYGNLAYAIADSGGRLLPLAAPVTLLVTTWIPAFGLLFTYVLLLFPDGAPPSRRWRPVAWLSAVPLSGYIVLLPTQWPLRGRAYLADIEVVNRAAYGTAVETAALDTLVAVLAAATLASLAALIWRFVHAGPVLRRQLMWIVYAAVMTTVILWFSGILLLVPSAVLDVLAAPLIPIAAGIAIFRYRLYDIDLVIRRTLIYAILMAILVALYLASVFALQRLLLGVLGARSTVAVAAATLLIAALFTPLRRRVSRFVDRRFYRSRIDAERALHSVTATLRREVEPERLTSAVLGVIDESLCPDHLSLWLRDGEEPH